MKRLILSALMLLFALLLGCASSGQFKKSEKVTLFLHDGHKIKCYVTHIGRDQVFFQATRASDAYNYGDMLNVGQIEKIRLANDAEMTVTEFREYRNSAQKSIAIQSKEQPATLTFDPLFEKLKHKDMDKMSEKEFQYFLMMKEQENILYQKNLEVQRQTAGMDKLSQQLQELKEHSVSPPVPSAVMAGPVRVAEPVPAITPQPQKTISFVNLLQRTEMTGAFLSRVRALEAKGHILAPEESALISQISNSAEWKQLQSELQMAGEQANKALEQAFLLQPEVLKSQLGLVFGPEDAFDFSALLQQLQQKAGSEISIGYQRSLAQILGDEGSRAVRNLLRQFEAWQFISERP
jgi:hypothetical protein